RDRDDLCRRPARRLGESHLEGDTWRPPEDRAGAAYVSLDMALLAWPRRLMTDRIRRWRVAARRNDVIRQLPDRRLPAASQVDHGLIARRIAERSDPRVDHVIDVHEVAGLPAVAENRDRFP